MSIVAISESAGSGGPEIGRGLASGLGYEFADREIIAKAAESYGEGVTELTHATLEKPTLWERLTNSQQRYIAYVESTICDLAARDNVVLVGLASTIVLARIPHVLRVRTNAPQRLRAEWVQHHLGLTREAGVDYVRQADRERAARVRFLYHVDWDDPSLYDVVLSTERLSVATAVRMIQHALADERFESRPAGRQSMLDLSATAQAKAALMANPTTRPRLISLTCENGALTLRGMVNTEAERSSVLQTVARVPGVTVVRNGLVVTSGGIAESAKGHGQFRHGEERSWGGYGGGWYERTAPSDDPSGSPSVPKGEDRRQG
ncbi:MAG: cytidylate kinase family protein [Candidatus Rokuibacteriota bacterium]